MWGEGGGCFAFKQNLSANYLFSDHNCLQGEGDIQTYPARLFHCSNASGRFRVEEVLDFAQEDLEEDDVMILDAWKELFVWVGESARKEEKRDAIKTAVVMLLFLKELRHTSRILKLA